MNNEFWKNVLHTFNFNYVYTHKKKHTHTQIQNHYKLLIDIQIETFSNQNPFLNLPIPSGCYDFKKRKKFNFYIPVLFFLLLINQFFFFAIVVCNNV